MRFAVTGLLQGVLLWGLLAARGLAWPTMITTALLYAALAVPLAIYFSEQVEALPARVRWLAVALFGLACALLGGYTAWVYEYGSNAIDVPATPALAAGVLGFISLNLLCGFDFGQRRWNYARLFQYTWRNGILLATAAAMTGLVWLVLLAGGALMKLIGLYEVMDLIKNPLFILPVTGLVSGGAFAMGLARASLTESIRGFGLSIASWLLPLVLLFGVLWVLVLVVVLPLTGLEALFNTHRAALLMLWFAALAVGATNCAYQDGSIDWPYPRWLARATQAAWLSLLPLVTLTWWALGLRIAQHGLSEQRLWAALAATLATIYALGYALSWLQPQRWMSWVARTNIAAAVVLCGVLLGFLSPLANVQRLAVNAHLRHLATADEKTEPDWTYLRWKSGRFGREALQAMADSGQGIPPGRPWARQATEALAQTSRYAARPSPFALNAQLIQEKFSVHPKGKRLPGDFLAYIAASAESWEFRGCVVEGEACAFWLGDLNGDRVDEIALFHTAADSQAALFGRTWQGWERVGTLVGTLEASGGWHQLPPEALDNARTVPSRWQDLVFGEYQHRLKVDLNFPY